MSRRMRTLVLAALLFPVLALAQAAGFVATVTAESTDLRKNASDTAPKVETIKRGTKLPAFGLSPDKKWVRVKSPDGTTLWAPRADVKVAKNTVSSEPDIVSVVEDDIPPGLAATPVARATPTGGARATPTPTGSTAKRPPPPGGAKKKKLGHVTAPKTKIQLNPTKSSPLIAVAQKNEMFEIGGFSRDKLWVKVRTADGRIGWVVKADMKPGRPAGGSAVATGTKPTRRPKDDFSDPSSGFEDPNSGFSDPNSGFSSGGRSSRRRTASSADTTIWADAGLVTINQTLETAEGYGYNLNASGYGAGIRFERRMVAGLFIEGGYLGTSNQRIPVPESAVTIFSSLHRGEIGLRYRFEFTDAEGPSISALAGVQNYSFLVQPQNLSWFYSQIYTGGAFGLGGEYGIGGLRLWGEGRALVPVSSTQRYGEGGAGGDGQNSTSSGIAYGGGVHYRFYSGSSIGVAYRGHFYETKYSGEGVRGTHIVTKAKVVDAFQTVTLNFARGF